MASTIAHHPDVATSDAPIAPGVDADVKKLSPKTAEMMANLTHIDEATLIKGLHEGDLSICASRGCSRRGARPS
jgi:hypothetical protein